MKSNAESNSKRGSNSHELELDHIAFYGRTLFEYQLFFWHR
jgi:hypothetical protein